MQQTTGKMSREKYNKHAEYYCRKVLQKADRVLSGNFPSLLRNERLIRYQAALIKYFK